MARSNEIRQQVQQLLDGKLSLRQFQEWFVPVAGSVAAEPDSEAERLVDDIDMSLSEYSDGVLNSSEFREELANAIRPLTRTGNFVLCRLVKLSADEPIRIPYPLIAGQRMSYAVAVNPRQFTINLGAVSPQTFRVAFGTEARPENREVGRVESPVVV